MRQAIYESRVEGQPSTQVDLSIPVDSNVDDKKTKFIVTAGNVLLAIFLQLWTWIVVLVLFLCAIYGERITAFRIVYMSLVLVFLATFQVRRWIGFPFNQNYFIFFPAVVSFMAKNSLPILDGRYCLFNVIACPDVLISVR